MWQPTDGIVVEKDEKNFAKINLESSCAVIWQRNMSSFLESWSQDLKWSRIRSFNTYIELDKLDALEDKLWEYFYSWKTKTPDMMYWFASDVRVLASHFLNLTHSSAAYLRLFPIYSNSENFFRESESDYMLISSYIGHPVEICQAHIEKTLPLLDALFLQKRHGEDVQMTRYRLPAFDEAKRSFVLTLASSS